MARSLATSIIERIRRVRPGLDVAGAIVAGIDVAADAKTTLIFVDRSARPVLVAKVARDEGAERDLEREHNGLTRLRSATHGPIAAQIPEPLALERFDGRLALVTTGIDGQPMMTRYYAPGHTDDRATVALDFTLASAWLADLQSVTSAGRVSFDDAVRAWGDRVLPRYFEQVGDSRDERALFDDAIACANDLRHVSVEACASHGDYWVGNILVNGGSIAGVIDWERAEPAGLPFSDVYKFPTSYGFYLDRASHRAGRRSAHPGRERLRAHWSRYGTWPNLIGFAYTYFGEGWFPDLVRSTVRAHFDRLQIPPAAHRAAFPLFLAEQALAISEPAFRSGYRSAILALSAERARTWLWASSEAAPTLETPTEAKR